jgi:hypothetical protein
MALALVSIWHLIFKLKELEINSPFLNKNPRKAFTFMNIYSVPTYYKSL